MYLGGGLIKGSPPPSPLGKKASAAICMNCYTWMELMKQGLEVLWWKHNMIPTKGSIQQPPPPPKASTYPRPATHLWHTCTHIQLFYSDVTETMVDFWGQPCWWGTESNCKSVYKQLSSSPPLRLLREESAKERKKEKSLKTLEVLKSAKVLPCMVNTHSWHTLLFRLKWAHLKDLHFQGPLLFL